MTHHEPLHDDASVVRGGLMEMHWLRESIADGYVAAGTFDLSFWGENGMSVDEIVRAAGSGLPQGRIRVSTVGALRANANEPYRSEPWPHLTVMFSREPTDNELEALVGAFGEAVPNPSPWG
jgi:hypothetical protein